MFQGQPPMRLLAFSGVLVVILFVFFFRRTEITPSYQSRTRPSAPAITDDIYNATLGFEHIFVVGLPSRSDRRDSMVLQAALSNIRIEFIDGVRGADVPDNAIPTSFQHDRLSDPSIGSWRAHMNAVREIVRRNLTSALILEDDTDWDVSIKDQLRDFALSSHALTQPLQRSPQSYADPTFPLPSKDAPLSADIAFHSLPGTIPPKSSPYGDEWDMLWVGHCGMHFPFKTSTIPKGRVIHKGDETVAQRKYLRSINQPFTLADKYPDHTRVVHHAQEGVCSLGYGLSQKGAQKLLYEVGLKDVTDAYDILLRFFCDGLEGRRTRRCLTVQPSLFHHYWRAGPMSATSDIGHHKGFRDKGASDMIRWSVRLNADKLFEGNTNLYDQFPDTQ